MLTDEVTHGTLVRVISVSLNKSVITMMISIDDQQPRFIRAAAPNLAVVLDIFSSPSKVNWVKVMTVTGDVGWVFRDEVELA